MANVKLTGRQYPLSTFVQLGIANIGAAAGYDIAIPPNGYVKEVYADTLTAFDGSTNTITITDGTTVFVNAQDIKSTGRETDAIPGKFYPSGGTISINLAQTGTATVGAVVASVEYVILNRTNEVQA